MPRSLVIGNGNILVNLDKRGLIHDFYFPYVGMEDQTTFGHYHRIGVFEEEPKKFTWLTESHWTASNSYVHETLVGKTVLKSELWQLEIMSVDFVHPIENVLCRVITVKNLDSKPRKLRMFFNFDFHIYGVKGNDTVYYSPKGNNLIFYKYNRYFLIDAKGPHGGMNQFATGKAEYRGLEGTWRDAEDGELSGHPIEQGSVDATFGLHFEVPAEQDVTLFTWICAAENPEEMERINARVQSTGIEEFLDYTQNYWCGWVNKQNFNFNGVSNDIVKLFKQSLLIIRSQIDNRGAIIAANDSDIMKFNKDTYSYMWPRDASFIAQTLDNTGYGEITRRFFLFCKEVQNKEGYLLHKYNPDRSLGSSWHPWLYKGVYQVPLQEDETAMPLVALKIHYMCTRDIEFAQLIFDTFILKSAEFLCRYRDETTGLPLPSYDLWEEQKGVFTYTCSTVYAGLIAASSLSNIVGHDEHARRYSHEAEKVKAAILKYLYCEKEKAFVKKIVFDENGNYTKDYQADASVCGIFLFDVLPPDDIRVINTMKRMREKLHVNTSVGGLARYENDRYQAVGYYPPEIPGNPWIITTLWYAQWLLRIAKDRKSYEFLEAENLIQWATQQADSTGVLPEQLNPYTGEHLSVSPLTWSHATYVDTIMLYRQRLKDFEV